MVQYIQVAPLPEAKEGTWEMYLIVVKEPITWQVSAKDIVYQNENHPPLIVYSDHIEGPFYFTMEPARSYRAKEKIVSKLPSY